MTDFVCSVCIPGLGIIYLPRPTLLPILVEINFGEQFHKITMSMNGDLTQRIPRKFTKQVALRDAERSVLMWVFNYVKRDCPPDNNRNSYTVYKTLKSELRDGKVTEFTGVKYPGAYDFECGVMSD